MEENKVIDEEVSGGAQASEETKPAKNAAVAEKKSRKQINEEREEARKKELASLSDDELYARIQTDKLLKSKRNRKIATVTSLVVAFVLALSVIVMAVVPYSYLPTCINVNVSSVRLYENSSTAVANITEDDERFSTFKSLLSSAFKQNFLTALFSGSVSSFEVDEKNGVQTDNAVALSNAVELAGDNYLIQFNYSTAQTFTYQNGKAYTSVYSSSSWDGTITYTTAYLAVNVDEDSGVCDTEIYIVGTYPSSSSTSGYITKIFVATVRADTSVIYSNWSSLLS